MKLYVTVKAGAKQNRLEKVEGNRYRVWVKEPPQEGKANQAIVEILSNYFRKPKSLFSLIRGTRSKEKVFLMEG